ncbi:aminoglycoside phosphotransferase family protein [Nonomuraea sp. NPDC050786]|uniref:aminoglycoside phosphotransferase family protein n=1 Tax=Nonomuraea sp. NPDC050786 TaxID=3154840 RepID=UPI00340ADFF7
MSEVPLVGGNNAAEVVRVGDTVRRARDNRADFAAQVLTYLESVGYPHAPRYRGIDEKDRDILTFVPGATTNHPTQRAPGAYARGGRMLRTLHEATAGTILAAGQECVIHGDPGPFNTIFQHGLPVAFIDWSSCRPGNRLDDLGYMAWTWCIQSQGRVPIDQQALHLRELRDGYGTVASEQLLDSMIRQQTSIAEREAANLDDPKTTTDRQLIHQHKNLLLAALR